MSKRTTASHHCKGITRPWIRQGLVAISLLALLLSGSANATTETKSLIVLDFELLDLTLLPNTPEEIERTAAVAPMLRQALAGNSGLRVIEMDSHTQAQADHGVGYLFEHGSVAADLAQLHGAEYIAVGRVHKPSFLFVYLMLRLVDVTHGVRVGDFVVEVKGQTPKALRGGVERLAEKVSATLAGFGRT